MILWHLSVVLFLLAIGRVHCNQRPNILLILADDLGYRDVEWHDPKLYTPNLKSLAFSQHTVYLQNSYVNQLCTPTRSSLMTGYYPFRTGTQNGVFLNMEASGVPLNFPFLPQNLRKLGYRNYLIGKWHLGYCKKEFLPTERGFDYFYGFYGAQEGYFNHSTDMYDRNTRSVVGGLDFFEEAGGQMRPIREKDGLYSTHLFTEETMRVLRKHPKTLPFFMFLSYQSPHAPLQAPAYYKKFCSAYFYDFKRMVYCAMMAALDESVGKVIQFLHEQKLYDNTMIIFSSDNGGDTKFGASNLPYRGEKNSVFEGGTKTITFFHSKRDFTKFRYYNELFHVVDWHPTLLGIAGASVMLYGDGINQWPTITQKGNKRYRRTQFIYNIDGGVAAIRKGDYKLIYEGHDLMHDTNVGKSRLFHLSVDPYETNDLARVQPALVSQLLRRLKHYARKQRPSVRTPVDPRGNPRRFGNVFGGYWC
ncbi:Sul-3 [Aphelenchoides bicaudatus]|nr:Sul-3 [Aphelenchoides bicaudatus]